MMINNESQNRVEKGGAKPETPDKLADMEKQKSTLGDRKSENIPSNSVDNITPEDKIKKEIKGEKLKPVFNSINESESSGGDKIYTSKDLILGFINTVTIILLIIFLVKLPGRADTLKNLKIDQFKNESVSLLPASELDNAIVKTDVMEKLFLDQSGIVDFVDEVEKLKIEGSTIQKISFASQKPLKDKTGFSGVPLVIELRGSWETIGTDLQQIESLPYLFRVVSVDASVFPDNPGVIDFKYGGFLYVNDKLGED